MTTPILGFIGHSNSGKTTLLTKIITQLTASDLKIGAIKHHHRNFTVDHEGKDSQRFTAAGAQKTIITGPQQTALIEQTSEQIPLELLATKYLDNLDLIIVEGFKQHAIPKIEVQRQELDLPLIGHGNNHCDPNLIAVISNGQPTLNLPLFNLEQISEICTFICNHFGISKSKESTV